MWRPHLLVHVPDALQDGLKRPRAWREGNDDALADVLWTQKEGEGEGG